MRRGRACRPGCSSRRPGKPAAAIVAAAQRHADGRQILAAQPGAFSPASYLFGFHASTVLSILNIGLSGLGVREFVMGYTADALGNDTLLSVFTASTFWMVSTVSAMPGLWVFWKDGFKARQPGKDGR